MVKQVFLVSFTLTIESPTVTNWSLSTCGWTFCWMLYVTKVRLNISIRLLSKEQWVRQAFIYWLLWLLLLLLLLLLYLEHSSRLPLLVILVPSLTLLIIEIFWANHPGKVLTNLSHWVCIVLNAWHIHALTVTTASHSSSLYILLLHDIILADLRHSFHHKWLKRWQCLGHHCIIVVIVYPIIVMLLLQWHIKLF